MDRRPDLVIANGSLPKFVIIAWDRAHPDRPYVVSEAYHGTVSGYNSRHCRCDRCRAAVNAAELARKHLRKAERDEELAAEFEGDA